MWTRVLLAGLTALLVTAGAGCGVKPPLKYVSPDGTLHDVAVVQGGLRPQRPDGEHGPGGERAVPAVDPTKAPTADDVHRPPTDETQAHFTTAVGFQAECRHEEALAYFRGVVEADPQGALAGRSLVRMAQVYLAEGYQGRDEQRARELLVEVVGRFSGTAAATAACDLMPDLCLPAG